MRRSIKSALGAFFSASPLNVILNLNVRDTLSEIIHEAGVKRVRGNLARLGMLHCKHLLLVLLFIAHGVSFAAPVVWIAGPARAFHVEQLSGYAIRRADIKCDDGFAVRLTEGGGYLPCESVDLYMELMDLGRSDEAERLLFFPRK